jgi:PAS domain S-box-containing protein
VANSVQEERGAEREGAELELQAKTERLSGVLDTQREIAARALDLSAVTQLVAERALSLTRAEGAIIRVLEGDELVARAAVGVAAAALDSRLPLAGSVTAAAVRAGQALLIEHFERDGTTPAEFEARSLVCVPLLSAGATVGSVIVVTCSEDRRLDEVDRQTVELLGVVLSSAVSHAQELEAKNQRVDALDRVETIFENAPIGMGMLGLDGRFIATNEAMRSITGFSAEELGKKVVSEYTPPEDVDLVVRNFQGLISGEHDSYRNEHRLYRKDGGIVWVDVAVALIRQGSGGQVAVVMAQDITRRRQAEEHLRESQKTEAIGQLSAGIAHDFNNLLTGVLGYASLALTKVDQGDAISEYLLRIEETAQRAASLTQQLLAFGRRQTLQLSTIDLNGLLGETSAMLGPLLAPRIEIVHDLDPALRPLKADPLQIQQVLLNLALNARDAIDDRGTLTIGTRNLDSGTETPVGHGLKPGPYVVLTFRDTGHGMTREVRERIFEPFFTTKGVGEGTGLGLSSVYGIVKQSEGEIEVETSVGGGTEFRIYLPAAEQVVAAGENDGLEPAEAGGTGDARRRLLLVEDETVVRDLVRVLLEAEGYEVTSAPDAETALELVDAEAPFDVLLTDLVLPQLQGLELADRVRELHPSLPVLYMSGYEGEQRVEPSLLLAKPFRNAQLIAKLDETLAASSA